MIHLGHGGQNYISNVLGCHFQTVMAGIAELTNGTETPEDRIRKKHQRTGFESLEGAKRKSSTWWKILMKFSLRS